MREQSYLKAKERSACKPARLLLLADEIRGHGAAHTTRLTVIKRWFEGSKRRLPAFAIFIATSAGNRRAKVAGDGAALFRSARALLRHRPIDRRAAQLLHDEVRTFQSEYVRVGWNVVRELRNHDLFLIEEGLGIFLPARTASPGESYRLAASFCEHYDSRYGAGLNGPSQARMREIARFMKAIEAEER